MSCPASTSCSCVGKPCDALSDQEGKISRSARRKLRYRNAARREWSPCFQPPPGLTLPSLRPVEELYDLVMILSERLQRIELLLFTASVEDFKVLDQHVNQLLGFYGKVEQSASWLSSSCCDSAADAGTSALVFHISDSQDDVNEEDQSVVGDIGDIDVLSMLAGMSCGCSDAHPSILLVDHTPLTFKGKSLLCCLRDRQDSSHNTVNEVRTICASSDSEGSRSTLMETDQWRVWKQQDKAV